MLEVLRGVPKRKYEITAERFRRKHDGKRNNGDGQDARRTLDGGHKPYNNKKNMAGAATAAHTYCIDGGRENDSGSRPRARRRFPLLSAGALKLQAEVLALGNLARERKGVGWL